MIGSTDEEKVKIEVNEKSNERLRLEAKPEKTQLKKVKNEDLTPFDFINMIRTDPEMQDEFCYLNRRNNAYDFKIVEFNERNTNEYLFYLDT